MPPILSGSIIRNTPLVMFAVMLGLLSLYFSGYDLRPGFSGTAPEKEFRILFATSSLLLMLAYIFSVAVSLLCMRECGVGKKKISISLITVFAILIFCLGYRFSISSHHFMQVESLIKVTDGCVFFTVFLMACALRFLYPTSDKAPRLELAKYIYLFKLQLYMASAMMLIGLLENFGLFAWQWGIKPAHMMVLAYGVLYTGTMAALFIPMAYGFHGLVAHTQKPNASGDNSASPSDEITIVSPITTIGSYIAVIAPALLGLLPSLFHL